MTDDYVPEHKGNPADEHEEPVTGDAPPKDNVLFGNDAYNKIKFVAQILLPAVATLYFALAGIWGLPNAEQVVGTITAIDLFLGALLGLSSVQYKNSSGRINGHVNIAPDEEGNTDLRVRMDPQALMNKDEITLKVHK